MRPDASLPPDRTHILTEQANPRTRELHGLSVRECVRALNDEDKTVALAVEAAGSAIARLIERIEPGFLRGGRLVYVGAGTSGRLGVLDASEIPPTFQLEHGRVIGLIAGGDRALRVSSEGLEDDPLGAKADLDSLELTNDDAVVGIAAGGTTPYVRGSLALAKARAPGCVTALISCSPVEPPDACDELVVVKTGPEALTGSTRMKAGTATKLVLNTISTTLMIRSGRVYRNLMVDLRATNDKLHDRAIRILVTLTGATREHARDVLQRAGGSVKVAVVMERLGVDAQTAARRLDEANGRLDAVIDGRDDNPNHGG